MRFVKLLMVLVVSGCLWSQATAQTGAEYPIGSHAGVIESLDFGDSTMVVSGLLYEVPVDVQVEIGGSYGAFTMLTPGMRIRFDYLSVSPSERRMVKIQELPAEVQLDET